MCEKDKYNFLVTPEYALNDDNELSIVTAMALELDWDTKDAGITRYRSEIREDYRKKQKSRCGFCRLRVNSSQFYPHLEHIVPKSVVERFRFDPKNLVFSCQRCNFGKSTYNPLENPLGDEDEIPYTSNEYKIVHPHLDDYLTYIDYVECLVTIPVNNHPKAINSIREYKLNRMGLVEDRAFENDYESSAEVIDILTRALAKYNTQEILDSIQEAIDAAPNFVFD